jgi:hypothetical protein
MGASLKRPIASAPIHWVIDALISEFFYLSAWGSAKHDWYFEIQRNLLTLGVIVKTGSIDDEIAASVGNRELGTLHLLNGSRDDETFVATTDLSSEVASLRVTFDMYQAPVLSPVV